MDLQRFAKARYENRYNQAEEDEKLRQQTEQMAAEEQSRQEAEQDPVNMGNRKSENKHEDPVSNLNGQQLRIEDSGPISETKNKTMQENDIKPEKRKIIDEKEVRNASEILRKYKDGKANLENRIIENEQWWKMRHWDYIRPKGEKTERHIEPTSAWLFNSIANKHADAMDNYPEPSVLPRAMDDDETAKQLSNILPVIIEQNEYEQVYSDKWWYKLKTGTGVSGVFWDNTKQNGLGDITIKKMNILNLFWEPGIDNIQDSKNFFSVALVNNEVLKEQYPDIRLGSGPSMDIAQYVHDENIDTTEKSMVVDWYYKKINQSGQTILHYVKYVNDTVLYASENDASTYGDDARPIYERGYYDHGKYPFVFDTLFTVEESPCGFGYIDAMKSCQEYIDKLNRDILENADFNARPRYFFRDNGSVNEDEFLDASKTLVHVNGNLGEDSIRRIEMDDLPSVYVEILNNKIDELKETSGNRDFSQGSTSSGVTAASAISALMEAGSKLTRDMLKSAYRAFTQECYLIVELIREFYDEPRCFRITGAGQKNDFMDFDNSQMKPQRNESDFGLDMGERIPVFDIYITAAKKSTYSRMSQNELALQFYDKGFFNPQQTDQSLACLEMMDFDGKQKIMEKIQENGTLLDKINVLQQQMIQMAQIMDEQNGTNAGDQLAQAFGSGAIGETANIPTKEETKTQAESSADRVRESTAVDGGDN